MSEEIRKGCGRGGRGALLLAQLEKFQRRPGVAPSESTDQDSSAAQSPTPTVTSESDSDSVPRGRASFLLGRGIGSSTPSPTPSKILGGRGALLLAGKGDVMQAKLEGGRGAILSSLLVGRGSTTSLPSVGSITSTVTSPSSRTSVSPITRDLQLVAIDQPRGTDGIQCNLEVNYVRMKIKPGMGVFEYHVNFNPIIDSSKIRFKIMKCDAVKAIIGDTRSFDGMKLRIPFQLPSLMTEIQTVMPTDETPVSVHLKFVGQAGEADMICHFNNLMKRIMNRLRLTLIGRNYFDHRAGIEVPQHKLEVWPGFVTAIQEFDDGVMLNCDASFRVLRTVTARDLLLDCYNIYKDNFREQFMKKIISCVILTRYNNKTYRIDDVEWNRTPSDSFQFRDGTSITYMEYYKTHYDIQIQDLKQPMLIHKDKPRGRDKDPTQPAEDTIICLVPELCFMTGLTDEMREDFKIMKDLAVYTRVTPNQRQLCLQKYIDNVNNTPEAKEVLSNWGIELDMKPMKVAGRILQPEVINVGRGKSFPANREADWGREMGRENVLSAINLNKWVIIFTKRDHPKAKDFAQMMSKVFPQMGVRVSEPEMRELVNDRVETYLRAAKDCINPSVQVIVFIMPTARDDRYNAVKKLCCVEMPVASQVINARTIAQPQKLRSVSQKIALQINCKLGGELWGVNIPLQKTMICGIDVYHDPIQKSRSVVGFVSSLNALCTRWYNVASFQEIGQELVDCLRTSLLSALRKFDEVNHFLPDKIVIYRDGVGDGQLRAVRDYEVEQLRMAFSHFNTGYSPSLIVIVVQKRINTRLFLDLGGPRGDLDNPQPGTVLDHTVTKKNWFDFYLVSQHVRQGTVSPTHYVVVCNQTKLKPDHLQKLSYKLTHMYYNWPGTVRVPAPCQYAHKLAYLCGQNIQKAASEILCDKLFFL